MGAVIGGFFGRSGRNQCGVGQRDPAPAEMTTGFVTTQPSIQKEAGERSRVMAGKYAYIPDNYNSLDQVIAALREAGLESSNLILGIDFTKSNDWTATTHDREVFSFHDDHSPCQGFEEVLMCYRKIVPNLKLSGPTSFAPIVDSAVYIVDRSGGQYHVLVIIADGQVTKNADTDGSDLSPQEEKTINSIVTASYFPLSIILVGVGDGPWEDMQKIDDRIPARAFDNFQFVNFSEIMAIKACSAKKEAAFALAALMEVPLQYKATKELGLLGVTTGKAKNVIFYPPPQSLNLRRPSHHSISDDRSEQPCPICWTNAMDLALGCGHTCCRGCGNKLTQCPVCRANITSRLRLYTG